MSGYVRKGLSALILIALVYLVFSFWTSRSLSQEVAAYADTLIQRDDVMVTQLEYQGGLFSGTLVYDLTWRPMEGEALEIREFLTLLDDFGLESGAAGGLRLRGHQRVQHGPWIGGSHRFGRARATVAIPLPDAARVYLPQYPGKTPLFSIELVAGLRGESIVSIRSADYRGRVVDEWGETVAQLTLLGMNIELRGNRAITRVGLHGNIDRWALEIPSDDISIDLTGLKFSSRQSLVTPSLWVGPQALNFDKLVFGFTETAGEIVGASIRSDDAVRGGQYESLTSLHFDAIRVLPYETGPVALSMRLSHVDASSYAALLEAVEAMYAGDGEADAYDSIYAALETILHKGPKLAVDPLTIAVADKDDISVSLYVGFDGFNRSETTEIEDVLRHLVLDGRVRIQHSALQALLRTRLAVDHEQGTRTLDARAQLELAELLESLQASEWVQVKDDHIEGTIRLEAGLFSRNAEEPVDLTTHFGNIDQAQQTARALLGFGSQDNALAGFMPGRSADVLMHLEEPLWPAQRLSSGFTPDPVRVDLIAGGQDALESILGADCVGYVTAAQPDIVIDYTAGHFDLYVYVDASHDTTLAIRDPNGRWFCNDDAPGLGLNPGLHFSDPVSGRYTVWVGNYSSGTGSATLLISELGMNP